MLELRVNSLKMNSIRALRPTAASPLTRRAFPPQGLHPTLCAACQHPTASYATAPGSRARKATEIAPRKQSGGPPPDPRIREYNRQLASHSKSYSISYAICLRNPLKARSDITSNTPKPHARSASPANAISATGPSTAPGNCSKPSSAGVKKWSWRGSTTACATRARRCG